MYGGHLKVAVPCLDDPPTSFNDPPPPRPGPPPLPPAHGPRGPWPDSGCTSPGHWSSRGWRPPPSSRPGLGERYGFLLFTVLFPLNKGCKTDHLWGYFIWKRGHFVWRGFILLGAFTQQRGQTAAPGGKWDRWPHPINEERVGGRDRILRTHISEIFFSRKIRKGGRNPLL